jgi:hypothetical protein
MMCCCQVDSNLPARVQDPTPAAVPSLAACGVFPGIVVVTYRSVPRRTAPRFGHAPTALFNLFSTFLI